MRRWEFEYEKEPKTPEQLRKDRRDEAWKNACPKTRQSCIQEVYVRTRAKQERTIADEVKTVAVGSLIIGILSNILG